MRLQNEIANVSLADPQRFQKQLTLKFELISLYLKTGNSTVTLALLKKLDKELLKAPMSISRCFAQAMLVEYDAKLGANNEASTLGNRTFQSMSSYVAQLGLQSRFKEQELVLREIIKLCQLIKKDPASTVIQYKLLTSACLDQHDYSAAEKVARKAVLYVETQQQAAVEENISALYCLAMVLERQAKYSEEESVLKKALNLCAKNFSSDNVFSKAIEVNLVSCYAHQGKPASGQKRLAEH